MNQQYETRTNEVRSNVLPNDSSIQNVQNLIQYLTKLKDNSEDNIHLVKIIHYRWYEGIETPTIVTEGCDTNLKEILDKIAPDVIEPGLSIEIILQIYQGMTELSHLQFKTDTITLENIRINNKDLNFRDVDTNNRQQVKSYLQGATFKIHQPNLSNQKELPFYNRQILDIWRQLLTRTCFQKQEDTALMIEQILKLQQNMQITRALLMIYNDESLFMGVKKLEELLSDQLKNPQSNIAQKMLDQQGYEVSQFFKPEVGVDDQFQTLDSNVTEHESQIIRQQNEEIKQLKHQQEQLNKSSTIASESEQKHTTLIKNQRASTENTISAVGLQIVSSLSVIAQDEEIKRIIEKLTSFFCALALKDALENNQHVQLNLQQIFLNLSEQELKKVLASFSTPNYSQKHQVSHISYLLKHSGLIIDLQAQTDRLDKGQAENITKELKKLDEMITEQL